MRPRERKRPWKTAESVMQRLRDVPEVRHLTAKDVFHLNIMAESHEDRERAIKTVHDALEDDVHDPETRMSVAKRIVDIVHEGRAREQERWKGH